MATYSDASGTTFKGTTFHEMICSDDAKPFRRYAMRTASGTAPAPGAIRGRGSAHRRAVELIAFVVVIAICGTGWYSACTQKRERTRLVDRVNELEKEAGVGAGPEVERLQKDFDEVKAENDSLNAKIDELLRRMTSLTLNTEATEAIAAVREQQIKRFSDSVRSLSILLPASERARFEADWLEYELASRHLASIEFIMKLHLDGKLLILDSGTARMARDVVTARAVHEERLGRVLKWFDLMRASHLRR